MALGKLTVDTEDGGWRCFVPAIGLLILSTCVLALLQLQPQNTKPLVLYFSPNTSLETAIIDTTQAGGHVLRVGTLPHSLIVQSSTPASTKNLISALYKAGAWLVTSATFGACGAASTSASASASQSSTSFR